MQYFVNVWNVVVATSENEEYQLEEMRDVEQMYTVNEEDVESFAIADGKLDILLTGIETYQEAEEKLKEYKASAILVIEA